MKRTVLTALHVAGSDGKRTASGATSDYNDLWLKCNNCLKRK